VSVDIGQSRGPCAGYVIDAEWAFQHDMAVADGLTDRGAALEAMAKSGLVIRYRKVHHVLGEGNFVLASSEGEFGGKAVAFYDMFRVAD
jgi:hypothetical protein